MRRRVRVSIASLGQLPADRLIPAGDLVLLVDGCWSTFKNRLWVLYDMALKPVGSDIAYFLDPYLRCGRENALGWQAALATIRGDILERVKALVSDGLPGFATIAREYGWVHQYCHWHLICALQRQLGWHRRYPPDPWLRNTIYRTLREVLVIRDGPRLEALCCQLRELIGQHNCTRQLRRIVGEFLRRRDDFRAYLRYPDLKLPRTTCTVESMHRLLRQAIGTANNPNSLLARAKAFIRLHPTCTCNSSAFAQI